MANLIIKSSADNLVLQGSDASPAITVGATGTTTFAENVTFSGTANNLGTVTSATTFPAGHVIKTHHLTYRITSNDSYSLSTTMAAVTYSSPGGAMTITGVTATEGNLLHIEGYGGTPDHVTDGSYSTSIGYIIDGTIYSQMNVFQYGSELSNQYGMWNGHVGMLFTVPASFTNKTISLAGRKQGGVGTHNMYIYTHNGAQELWMLIKEIQQ